MPDSRSALADVIYAGFLTTDLTDLDGTHTLSLDYSGTVDGYAADTVVLVMNGAGTTLQFGSSVDLDDGSGHSSPSTHFAFTVSSFAQLIYQGGGARDIVRGTSGSDTFRGGAGDDIFYGQRGADLFFGGDGNDWVEFGGSRYADRAYGGSGDDTFLNLRLNDTVFGGTGEDSAWLSLRDQGEGVVVALDDLLASAHLSGIEHLALRLTEFDDALTLTHQHLMSTPEAGPDGYDLGQGDDSLTVDFRGGAGEILQWLGTHLASYSLNPDGSHSADPRQDVYFTGFEHLIVYATQNDDILAGGGNATLSGEGGDDVLSGATYYPEDSLVLYGGDGNDQLTLWAGWVDDDGIGAPVYTGAIAAGGSGNDTIRGGAGADLLVGDAGTDLLSGGDGSDTLRGGAGADTLLGEGANDELHGSFGNDELRGGDSRDRLYGGGGNDRLFGEGSTDALYGGMGDDTLSGGYNNDTLCGRDGRDTFFFEGLRGTGSDVIMDYEAGDVLHFAGGLTAADITAAVSGQDVRLSWSTGTVLVQFAAGMHIDMTFGL